MGITNNDIMTTPDGFSVDCAYISIGSNELNLYKDEDGNFVIDFIATCWKNQPWREENNAPFKFIAYSRKPVTNLNQSIYTTAYDYLKIDFPNYTNDGS